MPPCDSSSTNDPFKEREEFMRTSAAKWSLILLCFSMAGAIGGGLYEHMVLMPLWATSPPSSVAMIKPGTGVPLRGLWIPVHVAITVFLLFVWDCLERKEKHAASSLHRTSGSLCSIMRLSERGLFLHPPKMLAVPKGGGSGRCCLVLPCLFRPARVLLDARPTRSSSDHGSGPSGLPIVFSKRWA